MEIIRKAKPTKEVADVKLWYCHVCNVVHMSVKDLILNFSREEFAALTESVVDINYSGWDRPSPFPLIDLEGHDAVSHANASVH